MGVSRIRYIAILISVSVSIACCSSPAEPANKFPYPIVETVDHISTPTHTSVPTSATPIISRSTSTPSDGSWTFDEEELATLGAIYLETVRAPGPTLDPAYLATPVSTPAGDGYIVDSLHISGPDYYHEFHVVNYWFKENGLKNIILYAGVDGQDSEQGTIYVSNSSLHTVDRYDTPVKSGWVKVVDAYGQVVVLESKYGLTFYFNLPGRSFVAYPGDVVPTVTPPAL
jgi:hypothetical protein